ncbi:unnamed protein product, partial [Fusarium fujikuroi]
KANGSGEFVDNKALAVFVKNCFGNHIRGDISSSRAIAAAKTYEARFTHPPPRERECGLDSTAAFAAVLEARFNKIAYDPAGRKLGMGRELECLDILANKASAVSELRFQWFLTQRSPLRIEPRGIAEIGRIVDCICVLDYTLRSRNEVHSQHDEADSKITGNTYIEILSNMSYYIDSSGCITSKEEDIDTQFRLTFAPNRFQYLPQSDFRARRSEHAIVLSTELSL